MKTKTGFLYPSEIFDNKFKCIMSGELVVIVAQSNTGKTTFAQDIISRNAERGIKGHYINLEFAMETVYQNRWLWFHGKDKTSLTNLNPLTEEENNDMDEYVKSNLAKFSYYSNPNGLTLEQLENEIIFKANEGYELFVVDTFSRIQGNLDQNKARSSQNKCMEELQELAQRLQVAIILLHHTNRGGTFEGSQKIMDLANVFIIMERNEDCDGNVYTTYHLSKDKFVSNVDVDSYYQGGEYLDFKSN